MLRIRNSTKKSASWEVTVALKVNKLLVLYGTQRFTTVITRARQWPSSLAKWIHSILVFLSLVSLGGVRLSPTGTAATVGLLYQSRMIDDYGAVGGIRIGRGNRSTRRKPAPVPLCPPQILHDLTWNRTRAAAVGSPRLTAWAMARP
jgi:hypothetical protein